MKKSLQELKTMGWETCDNPKVSMKVYYPWRDGRAACDKCNDKGYVYCWGDGYGKGLGQCLRKKCSCRGGAQAQPHMDPEFKTALVWFKESEPPTDGFQLHRWQHIQDPEALWVKIWAELEAPSVYGYERVRDDVVALHQVLAMAYEEF